MRPSILSTAVAEQTTSLGEENKVDQYLALIL